ncbi:MAG: beta-galactosidase [Solirubrobacteraceae bacterium]
MAGALAAGVLAACVVGASAGASHPVARTKPSAAPAPSQFPPQPPDCKATTGTETPVVPETPRATLPSPPSGLVAWAIYRPGHPSYPSDIFAQKGDFAGLDFAIQWCNLEPSPNRFDWAPIETVMNEAQKAGMFVTLTVIPGFSTPRWVFRQPGVQYTKSSFSYHKVVTPTQLLPLPWNTAYLNLWYDFLRHMASEFRNDRNFVMVAVGGPTSISDEMSLPYWTGTPATRPDKNPNFDPAQKALGGSDIAMWEALDYDPATYVAAWARTFSMYREIFPNQHMSLSLIDGLPIIREHVFVGPPGHQISVEKEAIDGNEVTATPLAVIAAGRKYGSRFVLQSDGLGPTYASAPTYLYVQGNCGSIDTGFQTHNTQLEPELSISDLQPGVQAGVHYLEVYASLAKNGLAPLQGAITYADGALKTNSKTNSSYCQPLTLTASPQTAAPGTPTTLKATYETGLLSSLTFTYGADAPPYGIYHFTGSFNIGPDAPTPTCTTTAATSTTPALTTCTTTIRPRQSLTYTATITVAGTSSPVPVATAQASIVR